MATNINLASPEVASKERLSGKTSLLLSLLLLVLTVGVYFALKVFNSRYESREKQLTEEIGQVQAEIVGPNYLALADFQQRLTLLDKIVSEHISFDSYIRNFSKLVLPEVVLSGFDWSEAGNKVSIRGRAANFDILSKELMLLRNCTSVQSVDFRSASEVAAAEGSPGGVEFSAEVVLKKDAFKI